MKIDDMEEMLMSSGMEAEEIEEVMTRSTEVKVMRGTDNQIIPRELDVIMKLTMKLDDIEKMKSCSMEAEEKKEVRTKSLEVKVMRATDNQTIPRELDMMTLNQVRKNPRGYDRSDDGRSNR